MALGIAFVSTTLPYTFLFFQQDMAVTPTRVVAEAGGWRAEYSGDFTVAGNGNVQGIITDLTVSFGGVERFALSGLTADAAIVFTAITQQINPVAASEYMMRRDDTLRGSAESDAIYGFAGNDVIRGNLGFDQVYAGRGRDTVYGGDDADHLRGEAGNDVLFGGAGTDVVSGYDGKDRVDGGSGDDEVAGGAGADTFVFRRGDGSDEIIDFTEGVDRIEIRSGADEFADLVFSLGGRVISFADVQIELRLFDGTALTEDSFVFV